MSQLINSPHSSDVEQPHCRRTRADSSPAAGTNSNLSSVSPKADESAATAVSPAVVAATNSVIAKDGRDAQALRGRSSLDLPAASSGVAGLSNCIGEVDPRIEAMICELEAAGFFVAKMKLTTLRVAASSAIHSPVSATSIPTT